jgi:hypothetical protein
MTGEVSTTEEKPPTVISMETSSLLLFHIVFFEFLLTPIASIGLMCSPESVNMHDFLKVDGDS